MTLFPGLRGYAAERQLRVPAEASQVMGWLTDSDRREREWLRQVEAQIVAVLAVRTRFPLRWELQQFATVEPAGEATDITVRVQGQMVGIGRVLHLLGWRDTTTARFLTGEASRGADSFVSAVTAQFTESSP